MFLDFYSAVIFTRFVDYFCLNMFFDCCYFYTVSSIVLWHKVVWIEMVSFAFFYRVSIIRVLSLVLLGIFPLVSFIRFLWKLSFGFFHSICFIRFP